MEVVRIAPVGAKDERTIADLSYKLVHVVAAPPSASVIGRVLYRLGYPNESATRYYFAKYDAVRRALRERLATNPDAVHQLEGESMANIIPFVRMPRAIWLSNVEYLPMSIAGETRFRERRQWMEAGKLRMLHLGRVSHLPSYR